MRSRGLVVAIAVVLAVLAAVGVIVYTSNVEESAVNENTDARVVVLAGHPGEHAARSADRAGRVHDGRTSRNECVVAGRRHRASISSRARRPRRRSTRTSRSRSPGVTGVEHLRHHAGQRGARPAGRRSGRGQRRRSQQGDSVASVRDVPAGTPRDEAEPEEAPHARADLRTAQRRRRARAAQT